MNQQFTFTIKRTLFDENVSHDKQPFQQPGALG